ncbi:MAG: hypothetical protein ACSHX8_14690 [Opitutaceae bacterium]
MFKHTLILCLGLSTTLLTLHAQPVVESSAVSSLAAPRNSSLSTGANSLDPRNYGYGFWSNGFRKNADNDSPDLLCIETGHYGLTLDLGNIGNAQFGRMGHGDYATGLNNGGPASQALAPAELLIQIGNADNIYTATHCVTGPPKDARRLRNNRLWESGRYLQNFDIRQLVFENAEGTSLDCDARLQVVGWPDSLTFTLEITPTAVSDETQKAQHSWHNIATRIHFKTTEKTWEARTPVIEQWKAGETKRLTLNCDLTPEQAAVTETPINVHTDDGQKIEAFFNPELNCQVAEIKKLKRSWKTGYTDIRDYDEFIIKVQNDSDHPREIPFMLYLRKVANITGLMPILCYEDGTPTGIPVQLSKNWHSKELGSYLRAYTILPANSGKQNYKLRIAYGFYGTLPSASHAQLSLVGYSDKGGNGRWDQLAIGCWGETICFDVDRSLVDVAITDVRLLMARNGADGNKWGWTNAGWGGDWLNALDDNGGRHHPNKLKTAYYAHGPCLTDARYHGNLGSQAEITFDAKVQTLRTDDYARTFQKFHYTFDKVVSTSGAWVFKMGRTSRYATPRIAYGNADGLLEDIAVPDTLKKGDTLVEEVEINGSAPWWVSFPGASQTHDDGKGIGYRALVIRSYRATLGGEVYTQPSISTPLYQANKDGSKNLDLLLTAPKGVKSFLSGDTIEMDLEWITLHREVDDYYGPNETYRQHLIENPNSWKTIYREAIGNDLKVEVAGGKLLNNYPIQIRAESDEIAVDIKGGLGYVPISFEGLSTATGYTLYQIDGEKSIPLDQSVHGNDFWQTDYDTTTRTYSRVYNLPLDGVVSSKWVLRRD